MRSLKPLLAGFAALCLTSISATDARALQIKVSINSEPPLVGPDTSTGCSGAVCSSVLIVAASPGDRLTITLALGTDSPILSYASIVSDVDTAEIKRVDSSGVDLTGLDFFGAGPNWPSPEQSYTASTAPGPAGFAGNGGELWRISYDVTNAISDAQTDITFAIASTGCSTPTGLCPGTFAPSVFVFATSLRVDAVPEPSTLLLFGVGLVGLTVRRTSTKQPRPSRRSART